MFYSVPRIVVIDTASVWHRSAQEAGEWIHRHVDSDILRTLATDDEAVLTHPVQAHMTSN